MDITVLIVITVQILVINELYLLFTVIAWLCKKIEFYYQVDLLGRNWTSVDIIRRNRTLPYSTWLQLIGMMVSASNNTSVDYLTKTSSQAWDATGNDTTSISRYVNWAIEVSS